MEDERTNRNGKKKINTSLGRRRLTIGGEGGIDGLLVFGGALAVAGFMAVTSFGTKKHKKKAIHPHQEQYLLDDDDDKVSLQYSTNQFGDDVTSCLTSNECGKTNDSSELILEEKIDDEPNSDCFHHQEIAFSDYSQAESATSSNENMVAEESSALFNVNNSGDCEQEKEKDESEDSLIASTETGDEEDDMDSDESTKTEEEDSSEATETSSLDDNEELMEHEYKKYFCESGVCSDLYADDDSYYARNKTAPKEAMWNRTASFPVMQRVQPSILTWFMSMLKLGLLMLLALLTCGLLQSLYVLDDDD